MRQHQPGGGAMFWVVKESANRRARRTIAKALEASRHAKPTNIWGLNTCNWVFRIQPDRSASEGRRHEEDGPTLLPPLRTHLAPPSGSRNSSLFAGRHQVEAHEVG